MKKSFRKWAGNYAVVAGVLAAVNWFLLWSRFYRFGFRGATQKIFQILNFPLSKVYLGIESKSNPWWNGAFGTRFSWLFNDEFGPMLALLILDLIQAAVFVLLFSGIRKLRRAI